MTRGRIDNADGKNADTELLLICVHGKVRERVCVVGAAVRKRLLQCWDLRGNRLSMSNHEDIRLWTSRGNLYALMVANTRIFEVRLTCNTKTIL